MQYYLPYTGPDNTPGLLRTYVSDGYQQAYRASVDLTALPIQEQPYTQGRRRILILDEHRNVKEGGKRLSLFFLGDVWYSGDFSVGVGGTTPARSVETFGKGVVIHRNGDTGCRGAWGNGKAQVSLALGNITSWTGNMSGGITLTLLRLQFHCLQ